MVSSSAYSSINPALFNQKKEKWTDEYKLKQARRELENIAKEKGLHFHVEHEEGMDYEARLGISVCRGTTELEAVETLCNYAKNFYYLL